MKGIFIIQPWPLFYKKGMKTWEIRAYPTDYRGNLVLIESRKNVAISLVELIDCIPLTKKLWEMNYEKHRVACSYEDLPYKSNSSPGYAWVFKNAYRFEESYTITREANRQVIQIDDSFIDGKNISPVEFKSERIASKFIGDSMLLYWLKKDYFALIAIVDIPTGRTRLINSEIAPNEEQYILNQINAK